MTNTSDRAGSPTPLTVRARWQRWEMESLGALRTRSEQRTHGTGQLPLADEPDPDAQARAKALEEARTLGYREGQEEGRRDGQAKGLEAGHTEGLERGRREGLLAGHQEGLAQGRQEGAAESQRQAEQLGRLVETCATAIHDLEAEAGQAMIRLATRIAAQFLHTELRENPRLIVDLVQDLLQTQVPQDTTLTLHLNPEDLALVEAFLQQEPDPDHYRLLADPTVSQGGCRLQTPYGSVDATFETRWQRITTALGLPAQAS
ncbi:MAG TPA: flagellar assembly protein FliH [Castellaniella sp.]|uniref:flagellar assembly protein FliH n=1 Tax=Castellaniella sp. TaxID=1955812 RepID=UPI002EFA1856